MFGFLTAGKSGKPASHPTPAPAVRRQTRVQVESVTISDEAIAMIVAEGQIAETDRTLFMLNQRRRRMLEKLRELEERIAENEAYKRRLQQSVAEASIRATAQALKPYYEQPRRVRR